MLSKEMEEKYLKAFAQALTKCECMGELRWRMDATPVRESIPFFHRELYKAIMALDGAEQTKKYMDEVMLERMQQDELENKAGSFLVYVNETERPLFWNWLVDKGFSGCKAVPPSYRNRCDSYRVDIEHKTFTLTIAASIDSIVYGNHAVTVEEFKTIFGIFDKYRGLELKTFNTETQKQQNAADDAKAAALLAPKTIPSFEEYWKRLRKCVADKYRTEADYEKYMQTIPEIIREWYEEDLADMEFLSMTQMQFDSFSGHSYCLFMLYE